MSVGICQVGELDMNTVDTISQKKIPGKQLIKIRRNIWYYVCALPGMICLAVFHYYPMYGAQIAFRDYKARRGITGSKWIGWTNFERFFNMPNFQRILYNTIYISMLKLIVSTVCTILLALLFNELRNKKFKRTVQTISYLPHFISWIILAGIFREMLSPSRGIVNQIIQFFGGEPINFLASNDKFVGVLVLTALWKGIGWSTVVYLAAIAAIDQEQYEAAYIDGANRLQLAKYITLPSITPTIITLLGLNLGGVLNAGFDQIWNMYNVNVYAVADIIDTFVYRTGIESADYSYASAIGLFKGVVGMVLVVSSNAIVRSLTKGEQRIW
jgi:putative aldouronate transport system permease protein